MKEFDLIILGQGSAAFAAAIKANELKIKTAMVGTNVTPGTVIGGTCVNVGCLPSKNLITVGTLFHSAANTPFQGIKYGKTKPNFERVMEQKDELVRKFRKEKYADVLKMLRHLTYIEGEGKFISRDQVKVGNKILRGEKFIVATGARANILSIKGAEEVGYLTNEEALDLRELPKSMCVIGGRALGLEFAQMYAQFGTKVTVLQRSKRILPEDEPEISAALTQCLEEIGIKVYTGASINFLRKEGQTKVINFTSKGTTREIKCEQLLFATGRRPNTEYLDLQKAGVKADQKGFIIIDDEMQTSAPDIWAAGDVTGEPMLETVAAREGAGAVENAFTRNKKKINFDEIPSAVFTYPEASRVGLTEEDTKRRGIRCSCRTLPLELVPKAHVTGDTRGLVKLVVNYDTRQIVGMSMLAPHAADIIHEGVLAVKYKLTIDDIIDTVHVFPTLSEAVKLAAQYFYKDVSKLSCCTE